MCMFDHRNRRKVQYIYVTRVVVRLFLYFLCSKLSFRHNFRSASTTSKKQPPSYAVLCTQNSDFRVFFCKCPARYYREIIESSKMVKKIGQYKKENGFLFCLFRPIFLIFIVDKKINYEKW